MSDCFILRIYLKLHKLYKIVGSLVDCSYKYKRKKTRTMSYYAFDNDVESITPAHSQPQMATPSASPGMPQQTNNQGIPVISVGPSASTGAVYAKPLQGPSNLIHARRTRLLGI